MGLAAFAIVLLLTSIALPVVASASEIRSGSSVDVGANDRITEDLYSSAGSVTISGTVTRDASIAAGRARIDGTVEGSVMLGAGRADVPGTIGGSLRIAGGVVEVGGDVDGDLVVLGGRVTVPSGGSIGGDVILAGGIVNLQGDIAGDIRGIAISTTIAGIVGGDVEIESSRVSVPGTARIAGDLRYLTAANPSVSVAANIAGTTERVAQVPWESSTGGASRPFGPLLRTVWALVAGVVIIALAPRLADVIGRSARAVPRAMGVGLIALIVIRRNRNPDRLDDRCPDRADRPRTVRCPALSQPGVRRTRDRPLHPSRPMERWQPWISFPRDDDRRHHPGRAEFHSASVCERRDRYSRHHVGRWCSLDGPGRDGIDVTTRWITRANCLLHGQEHVQRPRLAGVSAGPRIRLFPPSDRRGRSR